MSYFYHPKDNCAFLHGMYISPEQSSKGRDAIVACVKNVTTGVSQLHIIKQPMTSVYITRDGLRNYEHKKEYTRISDCDMYITPYRKQIDTLAEAMNIKAPESSFIAAKRVKSSPYTYGWDIHPLIRMKCEYMDHTQQDPTGLRIGMLDLETSVLGGQEILCGSICDWTSRRVHCFILNSWLGAKDVDELMKYAEKAYASFEQGLNARAKKIWDEQPVQPKFHLCDSEEQLITMMFKCIHYYKFDFLGVWNMGYDVPYIITRANFLGLDLPTLFSHPDVPAEFRMFEWKEDRKKVDHFTDTWHVVNAPGYTYWYDAMCLYSRLRKVKGREVFYTLDYIANRIIGAGKMDFGSNASHYAMQTQDQVGYCVYNTLDVVIPALMDAVTNDVSSMVALSDCSMLEDFSKQTVQLKAQFYRYLIGKRCIPGAVDGSMAAPTDVLIGNIGGAVLNPVLMKSKGIAALQESDTPTSIYRLSADIDVSSFYPSITVAFNVSRETKTSTVLYVDGAPYPPDQLVKMSGEQYKSSAIANAEYTNKLFGRLPCVMENAVAIGHEYFNLPDYEEMLSIVASQNS